MNPQYNKVGDIKPFLKYGCGILYNDADIKKINSFIDANFFKDKVRIGISGVKFTIYTPTELMRMIDIQRE